LILEIWEFYSSYIRFHEEAFGRMLRYNMNIKRNETDELRRDKRIREVRRIASIMPQLNNTKNRIFFSKEIHFRFINFCCLWESEMTASHRNALSNTNNVKWFLLYTRICMYIMYTVLHVWFSYEKKNYMCDISSQVSAMQFNLRCLNSMHFNDDDDDDDVR